MMFSVIKYKHLILKYLLGEASTAEQKQVEDYIAKSEGNKQLFESYRAILFVTQKKKVEYNADKAWEKVQKRIMASSKDNNGLLVLNNQSKKHSFTKYAVSAAAAMLVLLIGLVSVIKNGNVEMQKYATGTAISTPGLLPDGSTVILNSNTTLNFPEKFEQDVREVSIFGEAFFEVSHNPEKPFIIHASGLDIKVLGTSFNVEAYPGSDYVKVTVNTGRVVVYTAGTAENEIEQKGKVLTAGEIATYSRTSGVILKSVNDDLNVLSWKTGVLTFRDDRLTNVFKAFEEKYQKQFVVEDTGILNQRLTARFENQSLDDALETLSLIFNIKFENKEKQVIVHK